MISISAVVLFKRTRNEIKYFLLLIIIPGCIFFFLNDLLRNGMTSWWWRYLIFIGPGVILVMTNLLYKKIAGRLFYSICFLVLILIGISSIISIAESKHWNIGKKMNIYIENARFISKAEKPLLISDFVDNKSMVDFMVVMQECNSYNIDVLRASPGIDSVENRINHKEYSDIYIFYASDELTGNLKSQFDSRMEKLNVEGISPMWKLIIEK